jgi:hypothetical protein
MRIAVVLALALSGCAEEVAPATVAGEASPTKNDWLRATQRKIVLDHCGAGVPFRQCTDTTREECESTIGAALRPCVKSMRERLPERIDAGELDTRLRIELTGCAWHHAAFALGPARIDMRCLLTPS